MNCNCLTFHLSPGSLLGCILLLTACGDHKTTPDSSLFTQLSSEATGIDFINSNAEDEQHSIIAYDYFYNGGGVAVGDINNDSLPDIYFSANQGANKLYLNKGDFTFEDITEKAGVSAQNGWRTGVSMVDINADGYLDIYVCRSAEAHPMYRENSLYINNKDLTFTDKAFDYGLNDGSYSTQSAFLDYDQDGDLDLFLLNHSRQTISNAYDISRRNSEERVPHVGNRLYRNDQGTFTDVSDSLGIYGPASNYGLGMALGDINNDGWTDIYTSNDYTGKDKLLLNNQGQSFSEVSDSLLTHMSQFSMGVDMADINNDGWLDIVSLDMLPADNKGQKELHWPDKYDVYQAMVKNGLHHQYMRNMLHVNNANGTFSEIGQLAGISNTDWSWSALLADYDNDGLQDLFVTNGFKRAFTNNDFLAYQADLLMKKRQSKPIDEISEILQKMPSHEVHNYMFQNKGNLQFGNASTTWGFGAKTLSNGAAYADLDNDGDLDLIVNNLGEEAGIYRNNAEKSDNHFLKIRLQGSNANTFGLGARVTAYTGDTSMMRVQNPYRGFQSSMEPLLFFGLGNIASVDSLMICWPGGEVQKLTDITANQTLTLHQKDAVTKEGIEAPSTPTFFTKTDVSLDFAHEENSYVDFDVQPLLTRMYSTQGPAAASADINADGLADLYLGGAQGQAGALFIQTRQGGYKKLPQQAFQTDVDAEDVDAVFFDMDQDGDQDLYVVSGGYEYQPADPLLQDRLYRNDGKRNFTKITLPEMLVSGACVRPADIDQDGDLDLFVGGRIVPGRYPETPQSHILRNDGKGNFTVATDEIAPALSKLGMVTDALWLDVNRDEQADLIIAGEWMPLTVFVNEKGMLTDQSSTYMPENTQGWWNSLAAADFDKDGDLDLVAGNFGMNNQFKPTADKPVTLTYADFDNNGAVDPILQYYIGDQSYPSPTRTELTAQLPSFKKRFPDYASYAQTNSNDMFTSQETAHANVLKGYTLESSYLENKNGKFSMRPLPVEAQVAPVFALHVMDINQDGNPDLITAGNLDAIRARFGKATGNFGAALLGDGKGKFRTVSPVKSGLAVGGETRNIIESEKQLIFIRNGQSPLIYQLPSANVPQ